MLLPLFMLGAAAAQAPAVAPPTQAQYAGQRPGRPFMSPMGEPIFGGQNGEDGLAVWFAQTDSNHDGSITPDEMAADAQRFFETLDTNHDGEIDPDETAHYEQVIAPQVLSRMLQASQSMEPARDRREERDHRGRGGFVGKFEGGSNEVAAGRYGLLQIPEPVSSADADFNRGVSPQEFHRAAVQRFGLLDVDHTGRLTLSELQGVRQAAASEARRANNRKPSEDGEDNLENSTMGDQPE